ncbi:ribbon-helix-helix domain-containing protein [Klebsiella pneumoniae]|uniref:ribbon-helix-helix domain-containing protein n=1 Tax=Klebsiella pneumoniae TaxID=573 RepID=UPI001ABC0417|nr:ribbon-helix-helix domain-containing protein [Klebsiella pneumoniae]MBO3721232.1 ribbon-helix-helix domain-containing protein [Klebsiella pneumoniae]HCM5830646.1 ribbon-helix-helix domain-containing protein [Klebsiella pneumoniae]
MAEPFLKNRTRFTSSLDNRLVPLFNALSQKTRIPKSRLLDEAIEDLLKKHDIADNIDDEYDTHKRFDRLPR